MYRYSFPNNWFPGSISEKNQWHEMKATLVGNRFYDGKLNHQADGLHCNVNVGGSACLFWLPLVCKIEEVIAVERCSFVTDFLLFFLLWTTLAHWMHSCDGLVTFFRWGRLRDEPKKVSLLVDRVTGRAVFVTQRARPLEFHLNISQQWNYIVWSMTVFTKSLVENVSRARPF